MDASGSPRLRLSDAEVAADFAGEETVDFRVARDRRAAAICRIAPPRMIAPFANEHAAMRRKVAEQCAPFHTESIASSYPLPA